MEKYQFYFTEINWSRLYNKLIQIQIYLIEVIYIFMSKINIIFEIIKKICAYIQIYIERNEIARDIVNC